MIAWLVQIDSMGVKDSFLIVIGASAGGMQAIRGLLSTLDPGINATVCIVLHLSQKGGSELFLDRLQQHTTMPCSIAADNMPLQKGHIYLAAADYHMIIKDNRLLLGRGPAESRWRPSIDVTMRSAAVAWNTHCIGIILSGLLNDGVAGMDAIRRCGGLTIVQDIDEADYPDMPKAVLDNVATDRCLPTAAMPQAVEEYMQAAPEKRAPPNDVLFEAMLAEQVASRIDHMQKPGSRHSYYTCPDCGGGLWEIDDDKMIRYRCHIGHTYTEDELARSQGEKIEDTLWIALRMMEERRHLLLKIANKEDMQGFRSLASQHYGQADDIELHIERLKEFLFSFQKFGKN